MMVGPLSLQAINAVVHLHVLISVKTCARTKQSFIALHGYRVFHILCLPLNHFKHLLTGMGIILGGRRPSILF